MKGLVAILTLGLVVAFAAPAFAATPKTKADCEKHKMKWDETTKTCSKGM